MQPATPLRNRLRSRDPVIGTFIKLPTTDSIDIAQASGFDFAVVDVEHSQLDEGTARRLVRHAFAQELPVLVRIPHVDAGLINRLLEAGAAGIQLSTTRSLAQVEALVDACRYPPDGKRSISLSHAVAGYGALGLTDYLQEAAEGPLLVGQIETATTEDDLVELLVELDVGFVGTTDLTLSLGRPGALDDDHTVARIDEIAAACGTSGTALGGWVAEAGDLPGLERRDATYVMVGSDVQWLRSSAGTAATETRARIGP